MCLQTPAVPLNPNKLRKTLFAVVRPRSGSIIDVLQPCEQVFIFVLKRPASLDKAYLSFPCNKKKMSIKIAITSTEIEDEVTENDSEILQDKLHPEVDRGRGEQNSNHTGHLVADPAAPRTPSSFFTFCGLAG